MGILFNKKKGSKDTKTVKVDEYKWITEEEACEMLNNLKEYCNEQFVTKQELDNKIYNLNKDPYVPKKVDKIISNETRKLMFREDQLKLLIEQAKDYINIHYVTKVQFNEELKNKEESCSCGGKCKCADKTEININEAVSLYKKYVDDLVKNSNDISRDTTNK